MIGSLRGILASKSPPQLLLEVGGVGYEIEAPMSTFYVLPAVGQELRLLAHLVVREDAHVLYGFATEDERRLFRSLLKVTGVGPKMALSILSGVSVDAFAACVSSNDVASLTRIPGVGRKTANVVLNTAFGQPTMAVDTHIFRVANRTGLAPGKTPLAVELALLKRVPAEFLQDAHHWLILHGRYVCKARTPECWRCLVAEVCDFRRKTPAPDSAGR